jgi:hypothetical protein
MNPIVLHGELFQPQRVEGSCVEAPAGRQVGNHEQDVIDDDAPGRHVVGPVPVGLRCRVSLMAGWPNNW